MEHINIPAGEIHVPHNWEYADAAARLGADITDETLIGRVALQLDNGTYWRLSDVTPITWVPIVNWATLPDKPDTFPATAHTHDWDSIQNKPAAFLPSVHTHSFEDLEDVPSTFPPSAHTHSFDDLDDVPTTFPPSAHTHSFDDLDDVPTTFPPSTHTHTLGDLGAGTALGVIPNLGTVANRNCTIFGDSINHGATSINAFLHCWVRLFARAFNLEVGATSYGFAHMISVGGGATSEIHSIAFGGSSWSEVHSADAAHLPTGHAMRAGGATSTITVTVPSFQSRAFIYYEKRPGAASFTVNVNGTLAATTVTDDALGFGIQEVTMVDNGYGDNTIVIQSSAGAVQPAILGIGYMAAATEPVVNNYATSGRRIRYMGETMISAAMQESSMVILTLGVNDQGDADTDDTYYAEFMQRIGWLIQYANTYGVRMVVADFCWFAGPTSRTRLALRKLATDTGGLYIDLPGEIFKNREDIAVGAARQNYLQNILKMWFDGTHPNKLGHKWIFETISKRLGFSCTSKSAILAYHDWWMPLALKVSTAVYNYFTDTRVSSYKRNGSLYLIRVFVRKAASGAFPVGAYTIQDAWRAKSELAAFQGYSGPAFVRSDNNTVISTLSVSASGQINLNVHTTYINQQDFTFALHAPI